jgi:DivIVA domain-containing protein
MKLTPLDIHHKEFRHSLRGYSEEEVKAKEIIHNALQQKQKVAAELVRIKHAEEEFRARFRSMLDTHMRGLVEIGLPDDVTVLMGDTDDGVVGDVAVGTPAVSLEPQRAPEPVFQPEAEPELDTPEEPPAAGFVEAVSLGETEDPDLGLDVEPVFIDPKEFPSFDQLGERDDDLDIEEID